MAGLQLFGLRKDRATQRGQRWLQERRIEFHFIDLGVKPLSPSELESLARAAGGAEKLVDRGSDAFRRGGWEHRIFDPADEVPRHPELLILPILRRAPRAVIGFDEAAWKALAGLP